MRTVRLGAIWEEAKSAAEKDGESMATLVDRALRAELKRRNRRQLSG